MVRRNKRHSRKRGGSKSGKRSRSRRQSGGRWINGKWWTSLITADANIDSLTRRKGIDIKYTDSPSDRKWLIGNGETLANLHNGAKEGRYVAVISKLRGMAGLGIKNGDDQAPVELTDAEFCSLLIRDLGLSARYPNIAARLSEIGIDANDVCRIPAHMLTALPRRPRPSHVSAPDFGPASARNILLETDFSHKFAEGLGR